MNAVPAILLTHVSRFGIEISKIVPQMSNKDAQIFVLIPDSLREAIRERSLEWNVSIGTFLTAIFEKFISTARQIEAEPIPKNRGFSFPCPPEIHEALAEMSRSSGRTLSQLFQSFVTSFLEMTEADVNTQQTLKSFLASEDAEISFRWIVERSNVGLVGVDSAKKVPKTATRSKNVIPR